MGAVLIHRSGVHKGRKEKLGRSLTSLGRRPDNHIVFSESEVSHSHAKIQRSGDKYTLVDLDSTNGTFVNGNRINKTVLHNRDKIELGKNGPLLEFCIDETKSGDSPRLVPISGWWENGKSPVRLEQGIITLGRGKDNDIVVGRSHDPIVSTRHAEIRIQASSCMLEDLDSTNGTFVNDEQIRATNLHNGDRVELGKNGPVFEFHWKMEGPSHRRSHSAKSDRMLQKLVRAAKDGRGGEETMIMLHAAHEYYKRRRWPLMVVSIALLAGLVTAGVYGYRKMRENQQLRQQLAQRDNFYKMRNYDVELVARHDSLSKADRQSLRDKRLGLLAEYESYLEKVDWYAKKSPREKAVLRLARNLGETSLEVPQDFIVKALEGVEKWKSTSKLTMSLARAREQNFLKRIHAILDQYDLPPEFVFIALQESDYEPRAVGPETSNHEFAKGMWQLMPKTAREYGLKVGPLEKTNEYDPMDERHIADLSTQAAAKYLANLYSSKAAASGLLVMASYNYGQTRIIRQLDSLPNLPSQRNFWNFYRSGWVPEETRNYVMAIFSAALLCENPGLFAWGDMEPIDKEW